MITCQDDLFGDYDRIVSGVIEYLCSGRNVSLRRGSYIGRVVYQPELEGRGRSQNFLGSGGILNTRQLDDHTVSALTLYQRLSDTKLIDTVTDDVNVLINRVGTHLRELLRRHGRADEETVILVIILKFEILVL